MPLPRPSRLDALARGLPFAVDDVEAAAAVYVRWRAVGARADRDRALLWAYCFALRYFASKFAYERTGTPSDADAAVEDAVRRLVGSFDGGVRSPERFPQFVSVVCRRVLLSHRARRREHVEAPDDLLTVPADADAHDRTLTQRCLARAVGALPPAIGEVARMRLIEDMDYADIAEALGRPIDSVRTYHSKALRRLRQDPGLRAVRYGDRPPRADGARTGR